MVGNIVPRVNKKINLVLYFVKQMHAVSLFIKHKRFKTYFTFIIQLAMSCTSKNINFSFRLKLQLF